MYYCFDFDGTLVDSSEDFVETVNVIRRNHGESTIDREQVMNAIAEGNEEATRRILPVTESRPLEDLIEEFRSIYERRCTRHVEPYPGIEKLLESIAPARLSIVTNKQYSQTRKIIHKTQWDSYFDPVFGADSLDRRKPDPLPLRKVSEHWEVDPAEMTMIGDTWSDVRAGKELSCVTVGCTYGFGDTERLLEEDPDHVVESPSQLSELLNGAHT